MNASEAAAARQIEEMWGGDITILSRGWPDLLAIPHCGSSPHAIEVKSGGSSVQPHQEEMHKVLAEHFDMPTYIARTLPYSHRLTTIENYPK
jgi:hypothetical protein